MDKSTEATIRAAHEVAREIRLQAYAHQRKFGLSPEHDQALENLAKSWEYFANNLDKISRRSERG